MLSVSSEEILWPFPSGVWLIKFLFVCGRFAILPCPISSLPCHGQNQITKSPVFQLLFRHGTSRATSKPSSNGSKMGTQDRIDLCRRTFTRRYLRRNRTRNGGSSLDFESASSVKPASAKRTRCASASQSYGRYLDNSRCRLDRSPEDLPRFYGALRSGRGEFVNGVD